MRSVEAEASSIDEAIDSALKLLRTTRDRVEVEILVNATRGLFGIGARKAKVRATLRNPIDVELGRDRQESVGETAAPAAPAAASDHRVAQRAQRVLQEIVTHLGVSADIRAAEDGEHIVVDLAGDASGVLIGRRGQMLDALEYLVNRIVARDEGASARIIVDSNNYRVRRRQALEDLARRMGAEAKKRRKPVSLNPMSPGDRRIIHLILQEDPSLSTRSSGKGYYRRLVIVPARTGRTTRADG